MGMVMAATTIGGCAMCQDTHDYSPPVIGDAASGSYPSAGRAGSAISGTVSTAAVDEQEQELATR
ncbi:MAG: hypothetical protein A2W31_14080 [Planctomycetes bacterium RBG_16_64_10]|nr:MAG: hypothetical protein A2W31_14080 [Planctomycetes bacterium RBG_16_64_10]